ncbi:unnamed protein product [Eruca vesicaria subsp. sativa]|uniref:RNA polymerase II C-terminal domain phosphatase-like n=1 Tax=Eruca vesicaria subsp. sativa TaxID=29727 RepID=A0ABC8L983_ERUVS|nr:unnamed protein product [Eruca vesicaria subsp. sativa]
MSLRNHLTERLFRLFDKTKRRNKPSCLNEEKREKKLHLVLDLDHTLLHSIHVSQLSQKERYLIEETDSRVDLGRFEKGNPNEHLIKLRPFLEDFLQEANKLFCMYVYTMGTYRYAKSVLSFIDPDKIYFGDRVITREKSPCTKTLDLLSADKRRVVIVDDTSTVWPKHKRNVLKISKYIYFREGMKWESYAEKKRDESRSKGALSNVLKLLQKAHRRFEELDSNDLRLLIRDSCRQCCF